MNPACPYCGFASPWSCDHFTCPVCGHDIDVDDGDMYDDHESLRCRKVTE